MPRATSSTHRHRHSPAPYSTNRADRTNALEPTTYVVNHVTLKFPLHQQPPPGKPTACWFCDFETKRWSDLQRHVARHALNKSEVMLSCDVCDTKMLQASNITNHMRQHTGEVLKCQELLENGEPCNWANTDAPAFLRHRERDHEIIPKGRMKAQENGAVKSEKGRSARKHKPYSKRSSRKAAASKKDDPNTGADITNVQGASGLSELATNLQQMSLATYQHAMAPQVVDPFDPEVLAALERLQLQQPAPHPAAFYGQEPSAAKGEVSSPSFEVYPVQDLQHDVAPYGWSQTTQPEAAPQDPLTLACESWFPAPEASLEQYAATYGAYEAAAPYGPQDAFEIFAPAYPAYDAPVSFAPQAPLEDCTQGHSAYLVAPPMPVAGSAWYAAPAATGSCFYPPQPEFCATWPSELLDIPAGMGFEQPNVEEAPFEEPASLSSSLDFLGFNFNADLTFGFLNSGGFSAPLVSGMF